MFAIAKLTRHSLLYLGHSAGYVIAWFDFTIIDKQKSVRYNVHKEVRYAPYEYYKL